MSCHGRKHAYPAKTFITGAHLPAAEGRAACARRPPGSGQPRLQPRGVSLRAARQRARGAAPGCVVLWRKDFGHEAALGSVRVDPCDARRAVVTGDRGALSVLHLTAPERGRVEVRRGCALRAQCQGEEGCDLKRSLPTAGLSVLSARCAPRGTSAGAWRALACQPARCVLCTNTCVRCRRAACLACGASLQGSVTRQARVQGAAWLLGTSGHCTAGRLLTPAPTPNSLTHAGHS